MSKYAELFKTVTTGESAHAEPPEEAGSKGQGDRGGFTFLFVDDEESVLNALKRIFLDENYRILTATSADKALEIMGRENIHLIISDHRMPGITGAELLRDVKQQWPDTIRIMLTGYADIQSIMGAVNEGAVYKFITKPWNDEDLRLTVSLALQQYVLIEENRKLKEITKQQQLKIRNYSAHFNENRGIMGNILVKSGIIKKSDLDRAFKEKEDEEFLGETLVRLGLTTESKIVKALQEHLNLEYIDLREMTLSPGIVGFLPRDLCERNRLLPVKLADKQVTIAMADPSDIFKCDNIALMTGLKIAPVIARSSDIMFHLNRVYGNCPADVSLDIDGICGIEPLDEIDIIIEEEETEFNVHELIGSSEVPPVIRIVNAVISEAIRYKASDIHIEPKTKYSVIRYRIDGMLHSKIKIPSDLHPATISRIKILAKMDIAERRKPQDGRITVKSGVGIVDIRVSTMPTKIGRAHV